MIVNYKGRKIKLSKQDFKYLKSHNWYFHKVGSKEYLRGYIKGDRKSGLVYLHRIICKAKEVDHKDGNGLNNMRSNLRSCDRSLNNANRKDTGSKGVHFDKENNKFRASIHFRGKKICLGRYKTLKEAKLVYAKKAEELFGRFARSH